MNSSAAPLTAVIIEDDPDVQALLNEVFMSAGFETVLVGNGLDGIAAVEKYQPAITTLDINLPGIDGFEVARRLRKISSTFLIMLSALAEESDVVLGLGSGADEYLVKPFRPRELRARIEAALRRPAIDRQPVQQLTVVEDVVAGTAARNPAATASIPVVGGAPIDGWRSHREISLNFETRTVMVSQQEVDLTLTEFDLLATLLESKRRVRSKSDLALVLRGDAAGASFYVGEPDKRAIEAHIANLRRKIGDNSVEPRFIETVRGVGYRLTTQIETAGLVAV